MMSPTFSSTPTPYVNCTYLGRVGSFTTNSSGGLGSVRAGLGSLSKWSYGENPWLFFETARIRIDHQPAVEGCPQHYPDKMNGRLSPETSPAHQAPEHQLGTVLSTTAGIDARRTAHLTTSATIVRGSIVPVTALGDQERTDTNPRVEGSDLPTPVVVNSLARYLSEYDKEDSSFLIAGFSQGFRIPFQGDLPHKVPNNLLSAEQHPSIVDEKLLKELQANRIAGPFASPPFKNLVVSPIGLVPKKLPGEFRIIHHLSHPRGSSVNSGIDKQFTTVAYHTVDQAIDILCQLGPGAYMAKSDIKSAFRQIPVHPSCYHLLGFTWKSQFYYDRSLAMGLSASCQIFEKFSTALQWICEFHCDIAHILHILDDFVFIAPSKHQCGQYLSDFSKLCQNIAVPLALEKTAGPATTLTFAGIELDTRIMEARLPMEKVVRYRELVQVMHRELQSVIGSLNHCAYIIPAGRAFLRRLIELTIGTSQAHHHIRLNKSAREDLRTWDSFLQEFNRKAFFMDRMWQSSTSLHLYTDAAQSKGYGGVFQDRWFWGVWPENWKLHEITLLELYPILVAVHIWGRNLANKKITIHTDNQALTFILNKFSSKDKHIMVLIRQFTFHCMKHNILFRAEHIPGVFNTLADNLSRLDFQEFRRLSPTSRQDPDRIPDHLLPMNLSLS